MTRNNRRDLISEADSQPFMKDHKLVSRFVEKREVVN